MSEAVLALKTRLQHTPIGRSLQHLRQQWHQRQQPRTLILLYHRVCPIETDPQLLCVSPQHFAEHMAILARHYQPRSLRQGCEPTALNHPGQRAVLVTFDDGYEDNLRVARPILERYRIPATVFATTGAIGSDQEFWWDELERLLLLPGTIPEWLALTIQGAAYEWHLGTAATYTDADYQQHRTWTVLHPEAPTPRHTLYKTLCTLLRPLGVSERQQLLATLQNWAGVGAAGRSSHRPMTADQLKQLAAGGLVEIGAHSIHHPALATLSPADQLTEIQTSRATLEALLEQPVDSFAYPFGTGDDYTAETVQLLQQVGFQRACSNFPGWVTEASDRFQLPRWIVRNWDGPTFQRHLQEWFRG